MSIIIHFDTIESFNVKAVVANRLNGKMIPQPLVQIATIEKHSRKAKSIYRDSKTTVFNKSILIWFNILEISIPIMMNQDKRKKEECSDTPFLKPQEGSNIGKKTLVLDLDETLVHSSFKPISLPDIIVSIDSNGNQVNVYIKVRPGVFRFLQKMSELFEIVIFTASASQYAKAVVK